MFEYFILVSCKNSFSELIWIIIIVVIIKIMIRHAMFFKS